MGEQEQLPEEIDRLGAAIRYLREKKGMSLRALAKEVSLSAPFLSDVEHGRRNTDKLAEIASVLGVDIGMLSEFDSRLPRDVSEWIDANPELGKLLQEMKSSGRSVAELRRAFHDAKKP